jgi:hypothetical protein
MFIRETEGIYRFGSKRVYIKIEKGKSIRVRIGGGYMHIDEFISKFSHSEGYKIDTNSVINRFRNKLSVQKLADGA